LQARQCAQSVAAKLGSILYALHSCKDEHQATLVEILHAVAFIHFKIMSLLASTAYCFKAHPQFNMNTLVETLVPITGSSLFCRF
jgi:hypothetical protein